MHNAQPHLQPLIARCWNDAAFRKRLTEHPEETLRESGIDVPADINIKVLIDDDQTRHLVIPRKPDDLSDEQLTASAGAPCDISCLATRICW